MFPIKPPHSFGSPGPARPRIPQGPPRLQNIQRRQNIQRPPRRPNPFGMMHTPIQHQHQNPGISNMLSMFKTTEGNMDLGKITGTVQQVSQLYDQISPFITKFLNR